MNGKTPLVSGLKYHILDPGGNITLLVETRVQIRQQPLVAAELMKRHPGVEQVGFVRFPQPGIFGQLPELRMAGGEFCGNASLCAAVLYCLGREKAMPLRESEILLRVSGMKEPVRICLPEQDGDGYTAGILMPAASEISDAGFQFGNMKGRLPVVYLEGITHIIIEQDSVFSGFMNDRSSAEAAIRNWCEQLHAEGLGIMFLEGNEQAYELTPLVYIPGSDTVFWEHSCASGSCAAGMYLGNRSGRSSEYHFSEPGGVLRVNYDPLTGQTWLYNRIRLTEEGNESVPALKR